MAWTFEKCSVIVPGRNFQHIHKFLAKVVDEGNIIVILAGLRYTFGACCKISWRNHTNVPILSGKTTSTCLKEVHRKFSIIHKCLSSQVSGLFFSRKKLFFWRSSKLEEIAPPKKWRPNSSRIIPLWWEKIKAEAEVASATWNFEPCWTWCVYFVEPGDTWFSTQTTKNQPNYCRIAQIFRFRINQKTAWPKNKNASENLGFSKANHA